MQHLPTRKKIRLARSVYRQGYAFSITIATEGRYPWFRLYCDLAAMAVDLLTDIVKNRGTVLYAWCIMPNHIHLLLQDKDVVELVRLFKGTLTREGRRLEPDRALWQRSFYDHALRREESLSDVALYIWQNPVRAGMIDCACGYPWSGSLVWPDWKVKLDVYERAGINPAPTDYP
ncbi:MAG: transposase [Syntrophobacteraceae bacterium]